VSTLAPMRMAHATAGKLTQHNVIVARTRTESAHEHVARRQAAATACEEYSESQQEARRQSFQSTSPRLLFKSIALAARSDTGREHHGLCGDQRTRLCVSANRPTVRRRTVDDHTDSSTGLRRVATASSLSIDHHHEACSDHALLPDTLRAGASRAGDVSTVSHGGC
jgi:hypothetical protein